VLDATDVIAIHQLLGRYGHLIDARRWDDFTGLFTPDATIDYVGGTGRIERAGRAAIVEWFRDVDDQHPPAHHVTNIVVDEHAGPGGRVDVHSKFFAPFTQDGHVPKRMYGGDYHDVVVKTAAGWQFAHKHCLPRWNLAVVVDDAAPVHRRTF
jgi:3-phenylpropionate/cinnamic acid dioxygenase small subunit